MVSLLKKTRNRGLWAEKRAWSLRYREHGYFPLNRTQATKGSYLPDGKMGPFLVSIKSTEGDAITLSLKHVHEHLAKARDESKIPLIVLMWKDNGIMYAIAPFFFDQMGFDGWPDKK